MSYRLGPENAIHWPHWPGAQPGQWGTDVPGFYWALVYYRHPFFLLVVIVSADDWDNLWGSLWSKQDDPLCPSIIGSLS